jgi:phage baseplate assembly protein W
MSRLTKAVKSPEPEAFDIPPEIQAGYAAALRAISARVRLANIRIKQGRHAEAKAALDQLETVLPMPEGINWKAAKDAAARGKK